MSEDPSDPASESSLSKSSEPRPEINFESLRSALTPVNLMFDGRLYRDVKGLVTHINHASKRIAKEKPDYQGALTEITLLEAAFNAAFSQWENHLTSEIQRLKNSVETSGQNSLGATKQISKYEAELNRGRASTRSMPTKTSQVRNQLISACGNAGASDGSANSYTPKSRLSSTDKKLPAVFKNSVPQILRRAKKLDGGEGFAKLALRYLKNFSKPLEALEEDGPLQRGVLYYFRKPIEIDAELTPVEQQMTQFALIRGMNEKGDCYDFRSLFPELDRSLEIPVAQFESLQVELFEALDQKKILLKLLDAQFKEEDFADTFDRYYRIRQKAYDDKREAMFNPRQQKIHDYMTDLAFEFLGISHDHPGLEILFVSEINNQLQSR